MRVMKFGAVLVSELARIRTIVDLLQANQERPLVVVCAALDGLTDTLIAAARGASAGDEGLIESARRDLWSRHRALSEKLVRDEWEREALYREWAALLKTYDRVTRSLLTLGDPSPRGIDAVAALGERFITHLLAVVLRQGGIAAQVIDAADLIVTDNHFGAARPLPGESVERIRKRLRPLMQSRIVPVITGYIGATSAGVVTTLGRSGGDYTAALIGAALGADEIWLWTDVDGILTADPKIVPEARTLPELSYSEAAEIAALGAEVLHPRTLIPVAEHAMVLHLRNALQPERPGTRIVAQPRPAARPARAIISAHGLNLLTLTATGGDQWEPDMLTRALTRLAETRVDVLAATQSFGGRSLSLAVRANDAAFARDSLADLPVTEGRTPYQIESQAPVALVVLISAPDRGDLAPQALAALGRVGAHVLALVHSSPAVPLALIIPEDELNQVVQVLHSDLVLES